MEYIYRIKVSGDEAIGKNDYGVLPGVTRKGVMQQIQFDAAWHIPCRVNVDSRKIILNFVNPEFITKFANNINELSHVNK